MDEIQHKSKHQNYAIKWICYKIKMNDNSPLMKLVISLLALLTLNTIIFIFLLNSKKKIENNIQQKYKRQLEDFEDIDIIDTDVDTDITHYTSQGVIYLTDFIANNTNTDIDTGDTTHDTSHVSNVPITDNIINNCSGIEFFNGLCLIKKIIKKTLIIFII